MLLSSSSSSSKPTNASPSSSSMILIGFAAGCATILTVQYILVRRRRPRSSIEEVAKNATTIQTIPPLASSSSSSSIGVQRPSLSLTPMMRQEQLSRHYLYFGPMGMEQLHHARILIVGVGGVGSHAAHMLARAGIGHLKLIDYDQLTLSSLNRHACGVLADVGRPKVECLAHYLRQICPNEEYLHLETEQVMYTAATGAALLQVVVDSSSTVVTAPATSSTTTTTSKSSDVDDSCGQIILGQNDDHSGDGDGVCYWDMVLDCIDDIPTKAVLVADCLQRHIPIVSCMSAGGKADPTRLLLTDLRSAAKDPLATKLRLTLQQHHAAALPAHSLEDMDQLTIVYSSEKTVMKLADLTVEQKNIAAAASGSGDKNNLQQFGAVDGMRIRIVPVQGTMPAIMGQAMAAYCLNRLTTSTSTNTTTTTAGIVDIVGGNYPMQPATVEKLGKSTRHKLYQHFQNRERKLYDRVHTTYAVQAIRPVDEHNTALGEYVTFQQPQQRHRRIDDNNNIDDDNHNHNSNNVGQDNANTTSTTTSDTTTTWWVGTNVQINITDDLEYLLEIWRNRCCITGHRISTTLQLMRWDMSRPSTVDNIILIGDKERAAEQFDADQEAYKAAMDPIVRRSIEARLLQARVHL